MEKKRPDLLTVLCFLSWAWIGFNLYSVASTLMNGKLSPEELREQELTILEGQTEESIEMTQGVIEEAMEMLHIAQDKFMLLNGIELISLLLGAVGVFFMFKQRKLGFHLYIVYTLGSVLYFTYFFGHLSMGVAFAITSALLGGLFVLLYGLQLKHMK